MTLTLFPLCFPFLLPLTIAIPLVLNFSLHQALDCRLSSESLKSLFCDSRLAIFARSFLNVFLSAFKR